MHGLEGGMLLWHEGRNSIDLLPVENGVDTMDEPRSVGIGSVINWPCAIPSAIGSRGIATLSARFHFPELDLGSLFSFVYLPSVIGGLLVRHPTRVFVPLLKRGRHQVNRVTTSI